MNIGDMGVPFIYQGEELIYPEYIKDGLVLHYDFSGMTNNDASKDIAIDLSGNGNHGTLQNFNFTPESGYDKNKLLFDGVDDGVFSSDNDSLNLDKELTLETVFKINRVGNSMDLIAKGVTFGSSIGQNYSIAVFRTGTIYFETNNEGMRSSITYDLMDLVGQILVVQATAKSDGLKMYLNGSLVNSKEEIINEILPVDYPLGMSYNNARKLDGEIYSTKIYNRALTPEEVAHNYAIEKERFGIE